MAIPRGSVRHTIGEDILMLADSYLHPQGVAMRASVSQKAELEHLLCEVFSAPHAITFPFARTSLYFVLKSMKIPAGSEVLLTPITIGPMLEVIQALGLKPRFVDIELNTFGPDINHLAEQLRRRPAVFLLTYLFGYIPNLAEIVYACQKSSTPIIEDFSHNIGGEFDGKKLGTFGAAGIYSASLLKYVDGYNGAFVISDNSMMVEAMRSDAGQLNAPDFRRIRACIVRTLVWNLALNRHVFNLATFPALRVLKTFSRARFEKLLGPSIALNLRPSALPDYYFEDIAAVQCKMIKRQISRLESVLASRRKAAVAANEAWREVTGKGEASPSNPSASHTFWQYVVPVADVSRARDVLFRRGVETSTTNLMDLAFEMGVVLPNTRALKEKHLFIPLHRHLLRKNYVDIFKELQKASQL